MEILTVLRKALQDDATVSGLATGGIHMLRVEQNSERPNVMLMLIAGGDSLTLSGRDCLYQDMVRIYSRGDTFENATRLGKAVKAAMEAFTGTEYAIDVKLNDHKNSNGDYDDKAKVYRQIDDYRVHHTTV